MLSDLLRGWWPGMESNRRRQPFQGSRINHLQTCLVCFQRDTGVGCGLQLDSRSPASIIGLHVDSRFRTPTRAEPVLTRRHSRTSTAPGCTMRDGAAAKADPLAPSWANSASRRRVEGLSPPKAFSWRRYAIARVRKDRLISRDGAFPNMAFQRSRSSSIPSFDRLAISAASASRRIAGARRFMIAALDISRPSGRHSSSYVLLLEADDLPPNDTHIARFAARSQSCATGDFETPGAMQIRLICGTPPEVAGEAGPIRLTIAPI